MGSCWITAEPVQLPPPLRQRTTVFPIRPPLPSEGEQLGICESCGVPALRAHRRPIQVGGVTWLVCADCAAVLVDAPREPRQRVGTCVRCGATFTRLGRQKRRACDACLNAVAPPRSYICQGCGTLGMQAGPGRLRKWCPSCDTLMVRQRSVPKRTLVHVASAPPSRYTYRLGCRCEACVEVHRTYDRQYRERRSQAS